GSFDVAQLRARNVTDARTLNLDHISAHVAEQLCACRPALHVREIKNLYTLERLAGLTVWLAARARQPIVPAVRFSGADELHDLARRLFRRRSDFMFPDNLALSHSVSSNS